MRFPSPAARAAADAAIEPLDVGAPMSEYIDVWIAAYRAAGGAPPRESWGALDIKCASCTMRIVARQTSPKAVEVDPQTVARLAAEAQVDRRTAKKALTDGVDAVRGEFMRGRLRVAAQTLGLKL